MTHAEAERLPAGSRLVLTKPLLSSHPGTPREGYAAGELCTLERVTGSCVVARMANGVSLVLDWHDLEPLP